ncbi:amidohydrolase, partial [Reticulomyxa filosa]
MGAEESTQQQQEQSSKKDLSTDDISDVEVKEPTAEDMQKWFNSKFAVNVSAQAFELKEQITKIRRYFHRNPELSYQEQNTSKVIAHYLQKMKLDAVTEGVAGTGVVGLLKGDNPGPCILLRADMDALPVTEQNDVEFKSAKEGVMHACGHDCHMAILLGAAEILSKLREQIHGSIKFVFQPAEEGGAGGKKMIEEGVLENPHVDQVYGLHVWSYAKFGVGGHAAVPNGTKDAVVAVAQLVIQLHTIVPRN